MKSQRKARKKTEWLLLFWQRFYWQVYYFSMSVTCFNGLTNYRHIHKADTFIYSFLYWGKVFIDSLIVKNWNTQGARVIQHEFEISNSSRHSYILIFSRRKKPRDGMVMSSCLPKLKLFRAKIKQDDSGKKMFEKCVRSQNII